MRSENLFISQNLRFYENNLFDSLFRENNPRSDLILYTVFTHGFIAFSPDLLKKLLSEGKSRFL